jgi:2-keto-3-deoxy-L-rhamnonate aldolase RhmA
MQEATYIVPQPESRGAFEELEATLKLPGVKALFLAMTDASKELTNSARPDWYDERLWQYVHKAVALGREHGVVIGANTSYAYTMDELAARVNKLNDAGVRMIMLQTAPFLFQVAIGEFLGGLKGQLGI